MPNEKRIIVSEDSLEEGFPLFRVVATKPKPDIVEIEVEIRIEEGAGWKFFESRAYLTREEFEVIEELFEEDGK